MEDFVTHDEDLDNRFVTLENGNKIHIKRTDPHGFWRVNYDKGQLPEHLTGLYTSYDKALEAVQKYTEERAIVVKELEPKADKKKK